VEKGTDAGHAPAGSGLVSGAISAGTQRGDDVPATSETVDAARLDALLHSGN
jgi:aspartate 1-decarboxylase